VRIEKLKDQLDLATETGNPKYYNRARKIMEKLLSTTSPWPSLFGAFSVNEQFVESFTLYTLANAKYKLTSLALLIPRRNSTQIVRDIPASLSNRTKLNKMLNCLARHYPVP
jgi:hypothetical protein